MFEYVEPLVIDHKDVLIHPGQSVSLLYQAPLPWVFNLLRGQSDHPRAGLWVESIRTGHVELTWSALRLSTVLAPTPDFIIHHAKHMMKAFGISLDEAMNRVHVLFSEMTFVGRGSWLMPSTALTVRVRSDRKTPTILKLAAHGAIGHWKETP